MANSILTPTMITREALRVLHQKLNAVGNMSRQYDSRFARSGAKIGTTLDVRLPAKFTTRSNSTFSSQDVVERKVSLPVSTIKGIDTTLTDLEMTMSLNDFSEQIAQPAMAQLAASIEYDALSNLYQDVPNYVGTVSTQLTYKTFQEAGKVLTQNLAPMDNNRAFLLNPASRVEFSDAVKGLFQSSENIDKQYREGIVGRTGGFNVFENTLIPTHTPGAHGGTPLVNGASQGTDGTGNVWAATTSLATDGWTNSTTGIVKAGDIITIAGVYDVHPETKQSTGVLKRFTVTADADSGATTGPATLVISPAIIHTAGAYQNVNSVPADNAAITVVGTASTAYGQNLAFHRDAFIFATADLEVPQGMHQAAREVYDGVSMRFVRWFDGDAGTWKARFDVLYGYVAAYPELACRVVHQL